MRGRISLFGAKMDEITKRRLVYWLLCIMNSLAAAAQFNCSLAVYNDRFFQLEKEQLLSLVDGSTAQIQQIYKIIENFVEKEKTTSILG